MAGKHRQLKLVLGAAAAYLLVAGGFAACTTVRTSKVRSAEAAFASGVDPLVKALPRMATAGAPSLADACAKETFALESVVAYTGKSFAESEFPTWNGTYVGVVDSGGVVLEASLAFWRNPSFVETWIYFVFNHGPSWWLRASENAGHPPPSAVLLDRPLVLVQVVRDPVGDTPPRIDAELVEATSKRVLCAGSVEPRRHASFVTREATPDDLPLQRQAGIAYSSLAALADVRHVDLRSLDALGDKRRPVLATGWKDGWSEHPPAVVAHEPTPYESGPGRFRVTFPQGVVVETGTKDDFQVYGGTSSKTSARYSVAYHDLAGSAVDASTSLLQLALENELRATHAKLIRDEHVTIGGFAGRSVIAKMPDGGQQLAQFFVAGGRLYMIDVGQPGPHPPKDDAEAKAFFASFALIEN